jgi:hypothetical protein
MGEVRTTGTLNVQRFYETLGRILSDKYGCKVTYTVRPKEETEEKPEEGNEDKCG